MKSAIKLFVIDVDGTLTDGGIYYDENGNEFKKFCTKDAAGFFAAKQIGIKIMVLTGRASVATKRRMNELKVDYLFENIKDKKSFLDDFVRKNNINKKEICFIGDDLNDIPCMKEVGFVGCPADSCKEVLSIADYVSTVNAGYGAVRNIIEQILSKNGEWDKATRSVYGIGT